MNIKIGIDNLQHYLQAGQLRDYAHFLYLKALVYRKKSCYYGYNPDELASDMGCCRNSAISYLKRFQKRGWVRKHRGKLKSVNLIFIHTGKFADHRKGVLKEFRIEGSPKDILMRLQLLILQYKQSQFDKIKKLGCAITKASGSLASRRAKKAIEKLGYSAEQLPDQNTKFKISIRTISAWLHCSVGKASEIIKELANRRLITVYRSRQIIGMTKNGKIATALLDRYKNSYYTGKYVMVVSCNEYDF